MGELLRKQKTRPAYEKIVVFIGLVAAGVILNTIGAIATDIAGSVFYFDVIGTLVASMLGGMIPGILVALISPIITAATSDPMAISYMMVGVIIAIITSVMYEKGMLEKPQGIFCAILIDAALGGILGGIITWFVYGFDGGNASSNAVNVLVTGVGLSLFASEIIWAFLVDIVDKAISLLIALLIVHLLPEKIRKMFKIHAWKQAPLTTAAIKEMRKKRSRQYSLRIKLITLLTCASAIIGISAIYICYIMYFNSTVDRQKLYTMGTARIVAGMVDGNKIDEYLSGGKDNPEYQRVENNLRKIRESAPFAEYVYVYKIQPDGCHVVFDISTEDVEGTPVGEVIEFDESFAEYIPTLLEGGRIEPIISDDTFGWLLTIYEPVFNSQGEVTAYAGVDVLMDSLRAESRRYIIRVISMFLGVFALTLAIGLYLAEYQVILPLNTMAYTASMVSENDVNSMEEMAELFHQLSIYTGDETENLYKAFSYMTDENLEYLMDIRKKNETISRMQDALILVLADMVESRDKNTGDHVKKTAEYVKIIMNEMVKEGIYTDQLTGKFRSDVYRSAPLHDIGKISVSDAILNKNGKLTDEEFALMQGHTTAGAEILDKVMDTVPGSDEGYLQEARQMALYHHEKWNGKGYPTGLAGEDIPLSARIMAVADVFDALVSTRSYKKGFPFEKAIGIIEESIGSHFDPQVAGAFLNVQDEARRIMNRQYHDDNA